MLHRYSRITDYSRNREKNRITRDARYERFTKRYKTASTKAEVKKPVGIDYPYH